MRKIISASIIFFMCLSTVSVQASTNNIIQVSLDNIEEIMTEYSPELKIIDNNLEKAREEYKDLIDDIDDLENKIKSLENNIKILNEKELISDDDNKTLKKYNDELLVKKPKLTSLKDSKDAAKYNLRISRINYEKEVKQAVIAAQKQYIEYLDTVSKKENKQVEVNTKNKKLEIYKTKYDMGFISKKEYTLNSYDTTDLNNELKELNNKQEDEYKKLLLGLGLPNKKQIKFNTNIEMDLEKISKIDFEDDLDEMLDNNLDIQIRNIEIDKAEDASDISDYEIDNNKIHLKQEKDKEKLEFEKQYNNLKLSYNLIKSSAERLKHDQCDNLIMNTKYNYGFVSKKQIEDLENELNKKESDFISQKNNLYMNYLNYIQMKKGY